MKFNQNIKPGGSKIQTASQIPSQIYSEVKIRNIIRSASQIPSEIT